MPLDRSLPPIARRDATTLILGSLPGRRSLEMQQYYAHPQNTFWNLVAAIFETDVALPYPRRVRILTLNRIALWDVLAAAERPGSLDSSIVQHSARANDFARFYRGHPFVRRVFFNGQKAEETFRRFVLPGLGPQYAGMTFAEKLERWHEIRESES